MPEPDVHVDPAELHAAGTELIAAGDQVVAHARDCAALRPDPAWSAGFGSVAACARLGAAWLGDLDRQGREIAAFGSTLREAGRAWRSADEAAAAALRPRERPR